MPEEEHHDEFIQHLFLVMLLVILFFKFWFEAYFEKLQPRVGHNTGVIILMGIAVSYLIFRFAGDKTIMADLRFNETYFFNLILPSIMFPSGYNMRRKKFFKNIKIILIFGIMGTMICFAMFSASLFALQHFKLITKWSYEENDYVALEFGYFQVFTICSLLCSSDIIAAISMISYTQ